VGFTGGDEDANRAASPLWDSFLPFSWWRLLALRVSSSHPNATIAGRRNYPPNPIDGSTAAGWLCWAGMMQKSERRLTADLAE
jgi:hypothetical protein